MIIINADDFGADSSVTAAILQSFRQRYCSSTTLMTNAPGTAEACQLAHDHRLLDHVGLHLVLDEGEPLSPAIRKCPRFCDDSGRLCFRRAQPSLRLDTSEKSALADEIRAQIGAARRSGVPLTHVDSHHHVHTEWAVGSVLIAVCRDERIPFVRLARNCNGTGSRAKRVYKSWYALRLRWHGLARTRYFGSIDDCVAQFEKRPALQRSPSVEVMVHPLYGEADQLLDGQKGLELAASLARLDSYVEAVSFSGRRYDP